jgi:hypothetical protein
MTWRPAPLKEEGEIRDLRVKNTFIDLPSGLTPVGTHPMLTAPAALSKSLEASLGDYLSAPRPMTSLRQAAAQAAAAAASVAPWQHLPKNERLGSWAEAEDAERIGTDLWSAIASFGGESSDDTESSAGSSDGSRARERPAGALHPSIGSELHASGKCNKCCFFPRGKCANGYSCTFCHYDHEKLRRRSGKTGTAKGGAAAKSGGGSSAAKKKKKSAT